MKARFNLTGVILLSTTALGLAAPAWAQDAPGAGATTAQPEETALGSDTADDSDTIIVTARRVEENLQDVPISITVFNQDQLSNRNIVVASDLATYTPSLSVNERFGAEKASFSIRGFNQDIATAPTVGVYFADVVGVRAQGGTTSGNTVGAGSFMDLQNVQVLKGPQGTLFGRNTTGGAVLLVPNRPTSRFEGWIEGQVGDYDLRRVMGVVNLPLADTFKVRASFDRNTRDGFMRNRSGIGPKDYNDVDYWAGRVSVLAELTPNLENYTIATYSRSDNNGYAARIVSCDPNASRTSVRGLTSYAACDQIARQNARGDSIYDVEVSNPDPRVLLQTWQIINTTTWQASDTLTVKNIVSYGELKERNRFNLYSDNFAVSASTPTLSLSAAAPPIRLAVGTPFRYIQVGQGPGEDNAAQSTITEELQLQGRSADNKLTWVVGGYLEFSRPEGFSTGRTAVLLNCTSIQQAQCATPIPAVGSIGYSRVKFDFDNHGIFAQGTYNFSDMFALTLGGRYTFDRVEAYSQNTRISFLPAGGTILSCNDTLRFRDPGATRRIVTSTAQCASSFVEKSNEPTWLIDFDFKPTDDALFYAKYSRGYRQGGVSFINIGLETWGPEKIDAYEIGTKLTLGGPLRPFFNVAGFYNDLQDQQVFAATVASPASAAQGLSGASAIINAGKSVTKGVEVDAGITPFTGLRLNLGYTYLDAKLKSLTVPTLAAGSPYSAIVPTAIVGRSLTLSPKHRVSLSGNYRLPLPESVGDVSVGATYVYTTRQISNATAPGVLGIIPSTNILNLNANWNGAFGSPIDLAFFMTNALKEKYPVNTGGGFISGGVGDILVAPPRMYGFRLRVNFGG